MRNDPADSGSGEANTGAASSRQETPVAADPIQIKDGDRIGLIASLDDLPAVAKYHRRVGATAINFRRAEVREGIEGYQRAVGRISYADDGVITHDGEVEAPTEAEQAAIKLAFERATFPKMQALDALPDAPPGVNPADRNVFVCHDFDGRVVMLHQRYETKDGGKGYVPWTRWSDGQWRKMEPTALPFYGLPGYQKAAVLVIHEGAKAAARMQRLQSGEEPPERFPWWSELQHAHHVGWIGGAFAVGRSDWDKLAALNWSRVVIIADNDDKGFKAAKQISKSFTANVWIIAFDQRFDAAFDMADEWPADMFDDAGRYTGPSIRDCLLPATKATIELPARGRGRPTSVLRDEFAALVAYTVDPPRIIFRHNPSRDYRPEQFNTLYAPMSDVKDTAIKVFQRIECQHDRMIYRPGFGPGPLAVDGGRSFNVYQGGTEPIPGDPAPWLEYLAHMLPEPGDRELVLRWLATLIALPRIRMKYGLLLISATQGVGKSTLGVILSKVLGAPNVSFPSENSIVDSAFNSWLTRKRLIFANEIYCGHSRRPYDRLKTYMTDEVVEVNEKGVPQYPMENWAHFIACSNSDAALHLDNEDRRWLVPTVSDSLKPREWWDRLHGWLAADGPGIIARWAADYVASVDHVRPGDHAPDSIRKRAIVEGSRSEGQQLAAQLAEHLTGIDRKVILRTRDIRTWVAVQRGFCRAGDADLSDRRLEKPDTIVRVMKAVPGIVVWADKLRPKFGATRDSVVMNFTPSASEGWAEIKGYLTDLEGVGLDGPF